MSWVIMSRETYQYLQSDKTWGGFQTAERWKTFGAAYNNYFGEDTIDIREIPANNAEPKIRTATGYKTPTELADIIRRGVRLG